MNTRSRSYLRKRVLTLKALARLMLLHPKTLQSLLTVRKQKLTFLGPGALADLALAVHAIEKDQIPGLVIEAGAALGGSSILIASAKNAQRAFLIYDTFEMIPAPTEADGDDAHRRYDTIKGGKASGIGEDAYYGYQENLLDRVRASFAQSGFPTEPNNVQLIKGLVEQTMNIRQPVALAHIDCDWYSPVHTCLKQIVPCLSPGGRIIIDDYEHWSGARKAVDEFFVDQTNAFRFENLSRLHIVKK